MVVKRSQHTSVSMGNKLFVIGGYKNTSCEMFDSFSRKFTTIHSAVLTTIKPFNFEAACIGNKILVFAWNVILLETKMFIYDVINDSWSKKKN